VWEIPRPADENAGLRNDTMLYAEFRLSHYRRKLLTAKHAKKFREGRQEQQIPHITGDSECGES